MYEHFQILNTISIDYKFSLLHLKRKQTYSVESLTSSISDILDVISNVNSLHFS